MKSEKRVESTKVMGARMKTYEDKFHQYLDPTLPYMLRLDGHKFSSFTRCFKKPYDVRIHNAMVETTKELMDTFSCTTAYTCSDEITLVFPAVVPKEGQEIKQMVEVTHPNKKKKKARKTEQDPQSRIMFSGKAQKLITYTAGLASTAFYIHLVDQDFSGEDDSDRREFLKHARPYFDSRVFQVPDNEECVNNVIWRSCRDFRRNSMATLAQHNFSQKQLHKKNTRDMVAMLKAEKNIDWNNEPKWYKYGSFIKKQSVLKKATTPEGEEVEVTRHEFVEISFDFDQEPEQARFLLSKFLPTDYKPPADVILDSSFT
eukprot:TRINITY_DN6979_c0_g1_i1.p1 TRINITY_DN6979_c0_g1~~TRINITY_DN6979_c0_g1_i1.p1  ORF type:complete len:316 (+),score=51.02 TRINITY_DN6979_c0_g1_i1:47-994(+)